MDENPEAAAPATEASQPTNTQTEAPAEQPAEAPKTPTYDITDDQRKFIESNGGWEKVFEKAKMAISRPDPAPEKPEAPAQPEQKPAEPAQFQSNKPAEGFLSSNDYFARAYKDSLSNEPEYEKIADYVKGGSWLQEMRDMGMTPVDGQGNLNDRVIRRFLNLKASTVPATQTSTPVTSTPTVDYVAVGDTVSSVEDAYKVLQQNMALRVSGKAEHPKTAEANKVIKEHFAARRNVGRR